MEDTGRAFAFSRGALERISRLSVIVSCIALFFMSLYIGVDILVRKFFAVSIQGSDELSGYVLAFVSVWGFSYALIHKGHIRIEILYMKLSEKLKDSLTLSQWPLLPLSCGCSHTTATGCSVPPYQGIPWPTPHSRPHCGYPSCSGSWACSSSLLSFWSISCSHWSGFSRRSTGL